jgi:predicted metal-dependent hydrolase
MQHAISVNSQAALQHDGNARELLRRMMAEEQLANALGLGNSGRDMRAEIAGMRDQLKRMQCSVAQVATSAPWTAIGMTTLEDMSVRQSAVDQAAALAASAQAAAETAELAARAAARALEQSLSLSNSLHCEQTTRMEALSLAMQQQTTRLGDVVVRARGWDQIQRAHDLRLHEVETLMRSVRGHCQDLDDRHAACEARLSRAEQAVGLAVAGLNKSTRLWETMCV